MDQLVAYGGNTWPRPRSALLTWLRLKYTLSFVIIRTSIDVRRAKILLPGAPLMHSVAHPIGFGPTPDCQIPRPDRRVALASRDRLPHGLALWLRPHVDLHRTGKKRNYPSPDMRILRIFKLLIFKSYS